MKNYILSCLFICIFLLMGCTSTKPTDTGTSLPVIDVNKEYPVKRIDIHELAEVTYIPLQTTDNSLLQTPVCISISEDGIVVFDIMQYKFFFFDRQGRYLHTVNRFGQGAEEYYMAVHFDANFEKQELYVWNSDSKIMIYDFNGMYKKTLKLPEATSYIEKIIDYDSDYLIGFNDSHRPSSDRFRREADKEAFYLIDKETGTFQNFDKRLRTEKPVHHIFQMAKGLDGRYTLREGFSVAHILKNGDDCLLTNNALDTLYSYRQHQLEPVAIRTPSASTMDVPKLITPSVFTDSYFMFGIVPMDYEIGEKYYFDERMAPHYILDRKTHEISQIILYDSLLDPDLGIPNDNWRDTWNIFPHQKYISNHSKNQAIGRYWPEVLLEKLREGKLKGKLKEIASNLEEDDNYCIAIYKFK